MLLGSWRAKFRLWSVTIPRDHQNITTLRPLLHLSPISSSRTHIVGISASPSPFFLTRSLVSSSSSTPKKRKTGTNTKTRTKTSKKVCDLPTVAIDPDTGLPLPPLPAFQTQTKSTSKLPQRGGGNSEDLEWSRLVRDGLWPDTALAREVYDNGKRFPTDLLLTRVGMFYESYFGQAKEVANALNIRLTSKKFTIPDAIGKKKSTRSSKVSSSSSDTAASQFSTTTAIISTADSGKQQQLFPFAGFPVGGKSKYFKMLLDQGRSFVVVEEEPEKNSSGRKSRFIYRRYTPGTMMNDSWQNGEESRYLLSLVWDPRGSSSTSDKGDGGESAEEISGIPVGLAWIDISTDRAMTTRSTTLGELEHELARLGPVEIVLDKEMYERTGDEVRRKLDESLKDSGAYRSWVIAPEKTEYNESDQMQRPTPPRAQAESNGLPILELHATTLAENHLHSCLIDNMPVLLPPNHQSADQIMQIDASTLLGLEIRHSIRQTVGMPSISGKFASSPTSTTGTLLSVIRRTVTPGGTRLLVNSLCQPSAHLETIEARHDLVQVLFKQQELRQDLRTQLRDQVLKTQSSVSNGGGEISRILQKFVGSSNKVPANRIINDGSSLLAGGRDLWSLKTGFEVMDAIKSRIEEEIPHMPSERTNCLQKIIDGFQDLQALRDRIADSVVEEALKTAIQQEESGLGEDEVETESQQMEVPLSEKGQETANTASQWWIKPQFSPCLARLHDELASRILEKQQMEDSLKGQFGSPKLELKVGLLGIHVYVPNKPVSEKMSDLPEEIVLIASNKTAKSYFYNPWAVIQGQIQSLTDRIFAVQKDAFNELKKQVCAQRETILQNVAIMDELDLALGFAQVADELGFVRPEVHKGTDLQIVNGRHPTVEYGLMASNQSRNFVPNSLEFDRQSFLRIITGPNMGGKSTLLRQTAIIVILAQAGSFVPADSARIGIVDAVFSRVGASDNLYLDRSTFMMEMHETAHILRSATSKSLVIMDEIGRGTTTSSGTAIAYSTLEYILKHIGCRTLFATHYHELADMLGEPGMGDSNSTNKLPGTSTQGVSFWCTELNETPDGRFSYSYRLKPGVNRDSHAIKVAKLAGMPASFLMTAERTLRQLTSESKTP